MIKKILRTLLKFFSGMDLRQCRNVNRDVRNNHKVAGSRGSKLSLYQHLTTGPVLNPDPAEKFFFNLRLLFIPAPVSPCASQLRG
jgi:hypothetical protein